jgi:hypothetical protein
VLERLAAPSVRAAGGVTLDGQSFGGETTSGVLPRGTTYLVASTDGEYVIRLAPASAALVTLPR